MDGAGLSEAVPKNELLPANPRTLCKVCQRWKLMSEVEKVVVGGERC
jgi:hypothetical protein